MPKGYWIPHIDVDDPEGYKAYMAATPDVHRKYGGRALVRGGTFELMEGRARSRHVVREYGRTRLLPLAGISARQTVATAAFGDRFPDHRRPRGRATIPPPFPSPASGGG